MQHRVLQNLCNNIVYDKAVLLWSSSILNKLGLCSSICCKDSAQPCSPVGSPIDGIPNVFFLIKFLLY